MLIVGDSELVVFSWVKDGSAVTSGTATMQVRRSTGSTTEYLQSDETTFGAGVQSFSLTQVGDGWQRELVIPVAAKGENIEFRGSHSDSTLPPQSIVEYATERDLDDIRSGGGGIAMISGGTALTEEEKKQIARELAQDVWKVKKRTLTAFEFPVEIAGEKRRLDDLNDASLEQSKEAAKHAFDEQGYTEERAEKLDNLDQPVSSRESAETAAARAEKLGGVVAGRIDIVEETIAAVAAVAETGRDEARGARAAAEASRQDAPAAQEQVLEAFAATRGDMARRFDTVDERLSTLDTAEAAIARHGALVQEHARTREEQRDLQLEALARLDARAAELQAELADVQFEAQAIRDTVTKAEQQTTELVRERRAVRAAAARRLPARR